MVFLKKYILPSIIFMVITISCKDKIFTGDVNCDECYEDKLDSVDLTIHFTHNEQIIEVPVVLYKGNIDTGELIDTFYCFIDNFNIEHNLIYVAAENEYSAKAIYTAEDRTVIVVDGTEQKMKRVSDFCTDLPTCWISEDDELFLELAY